MDSKIRCIVNSLPVRININNNDDDDNNNNKYGNGTESWDL